MKPRETADQAETFEGALAALTIARGHARSDYALAQLLAAKGVPERRWGFALLVHGLSDGSEAPTAALSDYFLGLRMGARGARESIERRAFREREAWKAAATRAGIGDWIECLPGNWDAETKKRRPTSYRQRIGPLVREVLAEADRILDDGGYRDAGRFVAVTEDRVAIEHAAKLVARLRSADGQEPQKPSADEDSTGRRIATIHTHARRVQELAYTRARRHAIDQSQRGVDVDINEVAEAARRDALRRVVLAAAGQQQKTRPNESVAEAAERRDENLLVALRTLYREADARGLLGQFLETLADPEAPTDDSVQTLCLGDSVPDEECAEVPPDEDPDPGPSGPIGGQKCPPIDHPDAAKVKRCAIVDARAEAEYTVAVLGSVTAGTFGIAALDDAARALRAWRVYGSEEELAANLQHVLRWNARDGCSISLRFMGDDFGGKHGLVHLDDVPEDVRLALEPFALLTAETSPGNAQVVVAVVDDVGRPLSDEKTAEVAERFARRFQARGVNVGSTGAMRLPGSENRKPSRLLSDGTYPRVRLRSTRTGHRVPLAELEFYGLLAPRPVAPDRPQGRRPARRGAGPIEWPDYRLALEYSGTYTTGRLAGQPDEHRAAYRFAKWASERGFYEHEIVDRLRAECGWARDRKERDVRATVRRAMQKARVAV